MEAMVSEALVEALKPCIDRVVRPSEIADIIMNILTQLTEDTKSHLVEAHWDDEGVIHAEVRIRLD
jgi:hypothetical protein